MKSRTLASVAVTGSLVVGAAVLAGAVGRGAPATTSSEDPAEAAVRKGRPNVVVIMADDMRVDDLRYMPQTRRLIADKGVRMKNAVSPSPLCSPARASFLTGRLAHNHGVLVHDEDQGFGTFVDTSTLPVWLKAAGYETSFVGKYINGYGNQPAPDGSSSVDYVPPGWSDWRGSTEGGYDLDDPRNGSTYRYFDMTLNHDGVAEPHPGEYSTNLIGEESRDQIEEMAATGKPFFSYVNYVAPHIGKPDQDGDPAPVLNNQGALVEIKTPAVPNRVRGMFDDQITRPPGADQADLPVKDKAFFISRLPKINKAELRAMTIAVRKRAEAVWLMDKQVKRTVQTLRQAGQLKNTIIVVTSDNGYFEGEQRIRQGKTLPYAPSLQVPMVVRGPGIPRGITRSGLFSMVDFAPTFLDVANAPRPSALDGRSRLSVLRQGKGAGARAILTSTPDRDGEYPNDDRPAWDPVRDPRFTLGIRTPRYLYIANRSRERELYDLALDPDERVSVLGRPAYARPQAALAAELASIRDCRGKACWGRTPRVPDPSFGAGAKDPTTAELDRLRREFSTPSG